MLIAAGLLAYSLGAHFQYWGGNGLTVVQKGVSIGEPRKDEHLILFFPGGDWRTMVVKSGFYGDLDKSRAFIWQHRDQIGLPPK